MLYFFKKYPRPDWKQFVLANIIVVLILIVIFKILMPLVMKYFSALEIFFINQIGLPFHTGTLIAGLILAYVFYYLLKKSKEENRPLLERLTLMFLFLLIGFSSWIMLPIRANANTPINENNPSSARELLAYYNREQYGETHLFYGPYYTAYYFGLDKQEPYVDDKPKYEKDTVHGKYIIVNNYKKAKQNLTRKHKGLLPRMWDPSSAANYDKIMGRRPGSKRKPTLKDNLVFFWKYQLGYMYWRYFFWNWVGRQDDIQGHLDNHGNWISGIKFIDKKLTGPQDALPSDYKNNPARNVYYFLPLILGLLGMFFHYNKDPKRFYAVLLLFIFTGIGVLFYTNVKPFEPRERDYAVVVSFYTFALWIGMGVFALYEYLKKYLKPDYAAILVSISGLIAAPVLLAKENWFDHDRGRKYSARNIAKAYLASVDKNGIIFTIGDNDTFPLWYAQEVEGYRTDVKIINTSLLNTDWYIDQMKRKTYDAEGAPIRIPHKKYVYGTREIMIYQPMIQDTMDIKDFMKFILSEKEMQRGVPGSYFINPENGHKIYVYPTRYIRVPVNKENVIKYGIVPAKDSSLIVDEIILDLKENDLYKSHLAMLDILANNDWKRPVYFSGGSYRDSDYLWAKDYLQLDGMAYKLVPIKTPSKGAALGRVDAESMYKHVKEFDWKNFNANIYLDPETRRNSLLYRMNLFRLAKAFSAEKDTSKAKEILDLVFEKFPLNRYGYYYSVWDGLELYYQLGEKEKARKIARELLDHYLEYIKYFSAMPHRDLVENTSDVEDKLYKLNGTLGLIQQYDKDLYDQVKDTVNQALQPLLNE
jgi:ABC-type multidrug transport system fused ATPase/permease subunit